MADDQQNSGIAPQLSSEANNLPKNGVGDKPLTEEQKKRLEKERERRRRRRRRKRMALREQKKQTTTGLQQASNESEKKPLDDKPKASNVSKPKPVKQINLSEPLQEQPVPPVEESEQKIDDSVVPTIQDDVQSVDNERSDDGFSMVYSYQPHDDNSHVQILDDALLPQDADTQNSAMTNDLSVDQPLDQDTHPDLMPPPPPEVPIQSDEISLDNQTVPASGSTEAIEPALPNEEPLQQVESIEESLQENQPQASEEIQVAEAAQEEKPLDPFATQIFPDATTSEPEVNEPLEPISAEPQPDLYQPPAQSEPQIEPTVETEPVPQPEMPVRPEDIQIFPDMTPQEEEESFLSPQPTQNIDYSPITSSPRDRYDDGSAGNITQENYETQSAQPEEVEVIPPHTDHKETIEQDEGLPERMEGTTIRGDGGGSGSSQFFDRLLHIGQNISGLLRNFIGSGITKFLIILVILGGLGFYLYSSGLYRTPVDFVMNFFKPKEVEQVPVNQNPEVMKELGLTTAWLFAGNEGSLYHRFPPFLRTAFMFARLDQAIGEGALGLDTAYYYATGKHIIYETNLFIAYVANLREVQSLYQTDVYAMLNQVTNRQQKLEDYYNQLVTVNTTSRKIIQELQAEIDDLKVSYNSLTPDKAAFEADFYGSLEKFAGEKADFLLKSFIDVSQKQIALKARYAALDKLLGYYNRATQYLEVRIRAIESNKEALVQGIRVVDIPGANIDLIIREGS